jgi:deoxyribodipyrimidine photo-lyase
VSGHRHDAALVWFRRDLRVDDHAVLATALAEARRIHCVFVFDPEILDPLADRADRRVSFIHAALAELDARLAAAGGLALGQAALTVLHGRPPRAIAELAARLGVGAVYAGRDFEPAAKARDAAVAQALAADGRRLVLVKDQVIFGAGEIRTGTGRPYTVFTPYRRAWRRKLAEGADAALAVWPVPIVAGRLAAAGEGLQPLPAYGFTAAELAASGIVPGESAAAAALADFADRIGGYAQTRDFPALPGTSGLSPHLRFGTLSIRAAARAARSAMQGEGAPGAEAWLHELVWREFFFALIDAFPYSATHNFRAGFDRLAWADPQGAGAASFAAWCAGRTGYPLVDAGMRELAASGRLHNRVRMVVASFLCKHLGFDWRLGERFFAAHLLDYDLAANAGNWQWAASTGCDAQPWFRIFNPLTQSQRFDPQGEYIRRHVPELAGLSAREIHAPWRLPAARRPAGYPLPVVDHAAARGAALARFAALRHADSGACQKS